MNCNHCNKETNNPKFCSKSCAAIYNNTHYPKKAATLICKTCEKIIWKGRSYCKDCWQRKVKENSFAKWESITLAEMKGVGNANAGGRYPYIRTLARKKYLASDLPKYCIRCRYERHFEICHVTDIKLFPETATVSEVNSLDNLKALCPNCHWEYDNGIFYDIALGLLPVVGKSRKNIYKI